jgi:hypothetical protein
MKIYNDSIRYNEPLVTYSGIVIIVSQTIVVNSSTVSSLEITNVPSYGLTGSELVAHAEHATMQILNNEYPGGITIVGIDDTASHAIAQVEPEFNDSPSGTFSITIISNI